MAVAPPRSFPVGSVLQDAYEIAGELGSGGFGRVYRARQRSTGRTVAVKTLRLLDGDSEPFEERAIERFERELALCARLSHPNIVRLFDSGRTGDGLLYAVFEYVPGRTLADVLGTAGPLRAEETLHLMSQVLDALASAHQERVIHRDLKPENIMLNETGARRNALVLDFGLGMIAEEQGKHAADSRLTSRGELLGSPAYAAPEQLQGGAPGAGSDLYSWGLIFLECWTGVRIMDGASLPEILHKQFSTTPVPIPDELAHTDLGRLLRSATAKLPEARAHSASALLEELQRCGRDATRGAAPEGSAPARSSPARPAAERGRLSRVWLVPLRRNANFTGREALLRRTREALEADPLCAIYALHGLGGVGKTQLALEYAYRNASRYELVAWLRAEDPSSLSGDYAQLAEALGLPERSLPEQHLRVAAVRAWLEAHGGWLLVFDNASSPDAIRTYLPRGGNGHALVTSRHPGWRGMAGTLSVDVLERAEGVQLLLRRSGERDAAAAAALCEELGRLPLALEEAAAYIEATGRSLASYLALFRERCRELLAAGSAPLDYPSTVRGTWEISFVELERDEPAAAELLFVCAFLAPDDIPFSLLRSPAGPAADALRFDRCIATLRRYSLVKVEEDGVSIHRLVQLVSRDRLAAPSRELCAERALAMVAHEFPKSVAEGDLQPEARRLLPHAEAVLRDAGERPECAQTAARLLARTGTYLSARGLHGMASQHLGRAQELFERVATGSDPEQLTRVLANHALVLYALGVIDGAVQRLERALELVEERHGAHSPRGAGLQITLAAVLSRTAERARSRACAERALAVFGAAGAPASWLASMARSIIARVGLDLGRLDDVRRYSEPVLEAMRSSAGSHQPLLGFIVAHLNLGWVFLDCGQLEHARSVTERAIGIGEPAYGPDHPLIASLLAARGIVHRTFGELEQAQRCFERSLAAGRRTSLAAHPDIALCHAELAELLHQRGDRAGARANADDALESLKRTCGEPSRIEARAHAVLAALHQDDGHGGEALAHAEWAVRVLERQFGAQHPFLIHECNVLAGILSHAGCGAEAELQYTRALQIGEACFGPDYFRLEESWLGLAELARAGGSTERAALCAERARAIRERLLVG